jgi:hypothetical protein
VDPFRDLGRKVLQQVQQYPQRRPRAWRTPAPPLGEHAVGPVEVEPNGLDARLDHHDLMLIVAVVVGLLALGLIAAVAALLLGWF